ncbi:DgyrCDS14693 [Dimorphilus gyrociliatus]|uniref:DgyrCDS14693 n=1 Tax=Dimorphilus gyrociliatus TaxID=2664684 RepID=A0A7I8WEH3_9ANNE|nr:DgyrCDS14693 [Dimorphilus gyrociliatus]
MSSSFLVKIFFFFFVSLKTSAIETFCSIDNDCSSFENCSSGRCLCQLEYGQQICNDSNSLILDKNKNVAGTRILNMVGNSIHRCYETCLTDYSDDCLGFIFKDLNDGTYNCQFYKEISSLAFNSDYSLILLKNKKHAVCGIDENQLPLIEECYHQIWKENGCFGQQFKVETNYQTMTVLQFDNYAKDVYENSIKLYGVNLHSNFYRRICFEHMDGNEMNIAFNFKKIDYSGYFEGSLYDPKHVVDGLHDNKITLGSCTILKRLLRILQPIITIHLKGQHTLKKVILWPTNQQITQQLEIYMDNIFNICTDDNIILANNSPTTVLCNKLQQSRSSSLTVKSKNTNFLHLCEIEIISNNIAYLKGVTYKFSQMDLFILTDGFTSETTQVKIGGQYWIAINLFAYYNVLVIDFILPVQNTLSNQFRIELTNENPYLEYDPLKYSLCGEHPDNTESFISHFEISYSLLCPRGGVEGQFVVLRTQRATPVTFFLHSEEGFQQWARIDMFSKYTIYKMAILNGDMHGYNTARHINGLVSNYQDFSIQDYHLYSEKCFTNNEDFSGGEYRLWECKMPFPIEAYGQKIVDNDMVLLPIAHIDRNSNAKSISDKEESAQYPIKIIDGLANNAFTDGFLSCSGTLTTNNNEVGRITLYMDNQYLINQIGVLIPFEAPKG